MAQPTPLEPAPDGLAPGRAVFVKREDTHELGAFKWRGALPTLAEFARDGAAAVVTASTGNHGVATVLGDDLTGYAQTTAVALIALRRAMHERFVRRGLAFLRDRWHREAGRLTTAQAQVAFRLHAVQDQTERTTAVLERLHGRVERASTVGLAWSALATGPDELLEPLRGAE